MELITLSITCVIFVITSGVDVCIWRKSSKGADRYEEYLKPVESKLSFDKFVSTFYKILYVICWILILLLKLMITYQMIAGNGSTPINICIFIFAEILACLSSTVYTRKYILVIKKASFYKLVWKTLVLTIFIFIFDWCLLIEKQSINEFLSSPIVSFFGVAIFLTHSETCAEIIGQIMDKELHQ